uniref:Cadherin domain-containing protein n=1 Tax=Echeneis naucrates TaxID=173247 RepID=A0A665UJB5_ECHNA
MTKRTGHRDWRWQALWWHHFFLLWTTIDGQTRYSIPEELKQGSVVGNLAKDLGLGLSDILDRKLRVDSEAGEQYFSVDAGKGELVVNDRIDREALCGQSASCVLPLQVVAENPLQLHRIEVEIRDINDYSPFFSTEERSLTIAESTATKIQFPLEPAQDLDVVVVCLCVSLCDSVCWPCDGQVTCPGCTPISPSVSWDWLQQPPWPENG